MAVKWVRRWRDTGSKAPRPQGGDKRSDRIEAHAREILGLVAATHDSVILPAGVDLYEEHALQLDGTPNQPAVLAHVLIVSHNK